MSEMPIADRQRKELTPRQWRDIIAIEDEGIADKLYASLKASEEEKKRLEQEISNKDREISSLKAAVRGPLKQLKKLEMIVNAVDMTNDESEPDNKRPRTEPKSMHSIVHEQNQKLVQVKQEKLAAETSLESVRGEKEAVEANLRETAENLEDANKLVEQQARTTDIWQGRFDELVALMESATGQQVDGAAIAAIRNRSLATGL